MEYKMNDQIVISTDFTGGNICVQKTDGNTIYLKNELRDTQQDWFYWAFCITGAKGKTLTFTFCDKNRIGYFGPAISVDLQKWKWLDNGCTDTSFTYTFENDRVYFAHHMLYHPDRFFSFADRNHLEIQELCKTKKGNSVPCLHLGNGKNNILVTARHHACESTGNYVLEGFLEAYLHTPIENIHIFCVPFVDYDGVLYGDQGKARAPHDHNRDYDTMQPCLYPETRQIKDYIQANNVMYGFDFHSPWHLGGVNDTVFIVQNSEEKIARYRHFGNIFASSIAPDSFPYDSINDFPPNWEWNQCTAPSFSNFLMNYTSCTMSFSLETTYFGTKKQPVSQENIKNLGKCFYQAIKTLCAETAEEYND